MFDKVKTLKREMEDVRHRIIKQIFVGSRISRSFVP